MSIESKTGFWKIQQTNLTMTLQLKTYKPKESKQFTPWNCFFIAYRHRFQQDASNQCPEDRSKTVISSYVSTSTSTQTTQTNTEEEKSEDSYKLVEY